MVLVSHKGNAMLILTMKPGDRVLIGDNTWVTLTRINGSQVGIGFDAPKDVKIIRESVLVRDHGRRQ